MAKAEAEIKALNEFQRNQYVLNYYDCALLSAEEAKKHLELEHQAVLLVTEKLHLDLSAKKMVQKFKQLSETEALNVYLNIAKAIKEIQKKEIVHSDIKPANLMSVDESMDKIKLIDFGSAVKYEEEIPNGAPTNSPTEVNIEKKLTFYKSDVFGFATTAVIMEFSSEELEKKSNEKLKKKKFQSRKLSPKLQLN